jgi:hypothetical protein
VLGFTTQVDRFVGVEKGASGSTTIVVPTESAMAGANHPTHFQLKEQR